MATLAEMMFQSASESAQKGPDLLGAYVKGTELAQHAEQLQQKRAEIEQAKESNKLAKYDKVGGLFETYAKMPDGKARKAFGNTYIPAAIKGLGVDIDPTVMGMMTGDPDLSSFIVQQVRTGKATLGVLSSPEGIAKLAASPEYKQFGGLEMLKNTVEEFRPKIEEASGKYLDEKAKLDQANAAAGATARQRDITNPMELRKEVTSHPTTKTTLEMSSSYDKIRNTLGSKKPSAAGDIAGVFALMKMLDPASTVREGEQAQARQATGVPDQILNLYNRAVTGETLNAAQRRDFINQATKLYSSQYEKQKVLNQDFEAIAKSTGINPNLIFAGTRFKAPPPEAGGKTTFKVGTQELSKEDAKAFYTAHPQYQKSLDEKTKKDLGL